MKADKRTILRSIRIVAAAALACTALGFASAGQNGIASVQAGQHRGQAEYKLPTELPAGAPAKLVSENGNGAAGSPQMEAADSSVGDHGSRTVRVGIYQNAPKVFSDQSGHPAGIFVDLIEEIARLEHWNLEFVPGEWAECLQALSDHRIDLMPDVAYSRERELLFDFHNSQVVESWSQVYARKAGVTALADLNGRRVAVLQDSIQAAEFQRLMDGFGFEVTLVEVGSYEHAFELLRQGAVDATICNHFFGNANFRKYGLVSTPIVFNPVSLYFATAEGSNHDLLAAIDRHLAAWKLEPNSVYYKTLERWIGTSPVSALPGFLKWGVLVLGIILAFAAGFILLLRAQVRSKTAYLAKANESLSLANERFKRVIESKIVGIAITGSDGKVTQANDYFLKMVGCSSEECDRGEVNLRTSTPPEWRDRDDRAVQQLHETGVCAAYEKEFAGRNGDRTPVLLASSILPGTEDETVAFLLDISERKQAEQALADEALRRRMLVEHSRDGIVVLDAQGKVFEANQRYADMLGYTLDEVQELHVWDWEVAHPRETVQEMLDAVDESGDHYETRHRRKDGALIDVEISSNGVNVGGRKLIFCVCRDITDRKRAEQEMAEHDAMLRTILQNVPIGIGQMRNRLLEWANDGFLSMTGYTAEEIHGMSARELYPSDQEYERVGQILYSRLAQGLTSTVETTWVRKDGSTFDGLESMTAVEPGNVQGPCIISVMDVSDRAQSEKALKESEQLYRLLAENVTDVIWVADLNGTFKYFSPSVERQSGYTVEEALANPIFATLKPDSAERAKALLAEELARDYQPAVDRNRYRTLEVEELSKDGSDKWVEIQASFLRDSEGRPKEILGVSRDITARKEAEAELQRSHLELTEALEQLRLHQRQLVMSEKMASLGQLAAGVAHEINNPIAFVKSNMGTLRDYMKVLNQLLDANQQLASSAEVGDDKGVAAARQRIVNLEEQEDITFMLSDIDDLIGESIGGTERVRDIVQDLRKFAHAGKENAEQADINQIIKSSLRIAWNELKYKCDVKQNLGTLPALRCYPERLSQVFVNMFVNAAQAIEEHGELEVTTKAHRDLVAIRISDTGCGIKPEDLPRLFDPFYTTKEVGQGTGLGLAISHTTIQNHGGTIEVKSRPGRGTTFIIKLPLAGVTDG